MQPLAGRRAIVTGASKGLGRQLSQALVEAGCRVALFARPSPELDSLATELGDAAVPCPCDIRSPDQVESGFSQAVRAMGGVDILINNAAVVGLNRIEDASDEAVRREIETNLMGPIWTMREAAPLLRQSKGHIINVTSESVLQHPPYLALYAATKAAVEALSLGIKRELAPDVRVTILRLGRMTGSSLQQGWNPAVREAFMGQIKRFGLDADNGAAMDPAVVAQAVLAILSLSPTIASDLVVLRGPIQD